MANTMSAGMDTVILSKDTTQLMKHPRAILKYTHLLSSNKTIKLNWKWKFYENDTHGSIPLIGEYDALRFIFNFYKTPPMDDLLDKYPDIDVFIKNHYKKISKYMNYEILPPEFLLENLGYAFLSENKIDKAISVFKLNIENYPNNFNGYDSMADLYMAISDKKKAIECYNKALSIKEYPETRRKLNVALTGNK